MPLLWEGTWRRPFWKKRGQMKNSDLMKLPPATSCDSCPWCFYEPEYHYNKIQHLLWRPCVRGRGRNLQQRRGSRRRTKNAGGFPSRWISPLQQREAVKWRAVQIRRITKALEGRGVCMGAPVKESCSIWTIVSRSPLMLPDKRLCHSSIQEPAHSLLQLLSDRGKRSKYVSDELKLHEQCGARRPCSGEPI